MKHPRIVTDNSDLFTVEDEIKAFQATHKKKLTDDERNELGSLLNRRAKAISEVLGVEVRSIASDD